MFVFSLLNLITSTKLIQRIKVHILTVFVAGSFSLQWLSLENGAQDFLDKIWGNI
jgi:hypothetical protein